MFLVTISTLYPIVIQILVSSFASALTSDAAIIKRIFIFIT